MFNLSNSLSLLRAPLAFLFLFENATVRLIAILLAMITDSIDGYLARKWHTATRFGAVLDPAMDKFFVVVCFGAYFRNTIRSLARVDDDLSRFCTLSIWTLLKSLGNWPSYEFRAIRWGKITTALQFVVLIALTLGFSIPWYLYGAFVAFAVLALIELFQFKKSASTTS